MSKILVITTSLRAKSNSDRLADEMIRGGMTDIGEAEHNTKGQEKAYAFGKQLQ